MPINRVEPNWQMHSSFPYPVAGPSSASGAAPTVCLPINTGWVPYVMAAMQQLAQPAAWSSASPLGVLGTMDQAEELLNALATAGPCGQTWPEQVWVSSYNNGVTARLNTTGTTSATVQYALGLIQQSNYDIRGWSPVNGAYWGAAPSLPEIVVVDINGVYSNPSLATARGYYRLLQVGSDVWATTFSSHGIDVLLASTGAVIGTITHSGMVSSVGIAADVIGNIWVCNYTGSPAVLIFSPAGSFLGSFTPSGSYQCLDVTRVDYGGNSYMWITDLAQSRIYEVTTAFALHNTFAPAGLTEPYGIAAVGSNVWAGSINTLWILSTAGAILHTLAPPGLDLVTGILHIPAGP